MAQTKHEIQAILASAGSGPRQRFGQNFMIDQNLVRLVADAGELTADDLAIEVGPGTGTLTEELLSRAGRVLVVEIDRDLARVLRERFGANEKFELIEGDALAGKHELNAVLLERIDAIDAGTSASSVAPQRTRGASSGPTGRAKLVANLPYNIASPLAIEMLIAGVELLAFTVQKEVADRLRAVPSTEAYGPLTVMAQMLSRVEVLRTLPPQAFWPAPKIDSALVRMRRDDRLGNPAAAFGRFVQQVFSARRKTLRKALTFAAVEQPDAVLTSLSIDPQLRPENLAPEQMLALFEATRPATRQATRPPPAS